MVEIKVAVSGKGGVGKTTFVASISTILAKKHPVLAIDADTDFNLPYAFGLPMKMIESLVPIAEIDSIIRERVITAEGVFRVNPKVDDLIAKYSIKINENLDLLIMGTIKKANEGCACPKFTLLKRLLHFALKEKKYVILDMEAGLEHLGRGVTDKIDLLIIITEPTITSIATSKKIMQLASQLNIRKIQIVGNKIQSSDEIKFIQKHFLDCNYFFPFSEEIQAVERVEGCFINAFPKSEYTQLCQSFVNALF